MLRSERQVGRWLMDRFRALCAFVNWILDRPLPARDFAVLARVIMALFVVLATVLAMMAVTNQWMEYFQGYLNTSEARSIEPPVASNVVHPSRSGVHLEPVTGPLKTRWEYVRIGVLIGWLVVLGIHLGYWSLLAQDLVFTKRVEQMRLQTLLVPAALVGAYCLAAFRSHLSSIVAFACIYLVLALDETGALSKRNNRFRLQGSNRRDIVWLFIDIALVICLSLCIADYVVCLRLPEIHPTQPIIDRAYFYTIGIKDAIIAINLCGYGVVFLLSREVDRSTANVFYRGFLKYMVTPDGPADTNDPSPATPPPPAGNATAPPIEAATSAAVSVPPADHHDTRADLVTPAQLHEHYRRSNQALEATSLLDRVTGLRERAQKAGGLVIVDFGCGNSIRTIPLLHRLGIGDDQIKRFVGIDRDDSWEPDFRLNCTREHHGNRVKRFDHDFYTDVSEAFKDLHKADLLLASNIFYSDDLVQELTEAAQIAKNAAVVITGCAPYSFLGGPITESANHGFFPRSYYRWETTHLAEFVAKLKLVHVPKDALDNEAQRDHSPCHALRPWRAELAKTMGTAIVLGMLLFCALIFGHWMVALDEQWEVRTSLWISVLFALLLIIPILRFRRSPQKDGEDDDDDALPLYTPFAVISRHIRLNSEAVNSFVQWLEIRYGFRIALRYQWRLKRYLRVMRSIPEPEILSFHDIVYAFERPRANPDRPNRSSSNGAMTGGKELDGSPIAVQGKQDVPIAPAAQPASARAKLARFVRRIVPIR